jgi:hypothetical protein
MDPFNRYSKPSIHSSPRFTGPTATPMPSHGTSPTPLPNDRHRTAWKQPSSSPSSHVADIGVAPGQASIPHLREAIYDLDTTMASLLNQRKELQSHLEHAVRSQSPVLRLPGELLSSIFVIGVQAAEEEDQLMISCLMLVCRYWAEVAVDTPVLWSKITVGKHDSLNKACRKLARSKSVPVDLTINFDPRLGHASSVMESVVRAMDLFRPALWRARSFCLTVPNRAHAHAALLRCQENAPLLQVLTVRVSNSIGDDHHTRPPLPLFNGHTPRLRSCSFTSFNFNWDIRTVWRLRVLKLNGYFLDLAPSIETLLAILYECPDLEELVLRDISELADTDPFECLPGDENYRPSSQRVITLRHLKKVSIRCVGITRTRVILAHLSFPSLQDLDLGYLIDIRPIIHQLETQSLISLPLQRLHIESCVFSELKFGQLLRRLPSLTTLELIDCEDVSSCLLKVRNLSFRNESFLVGVRRFITIFALTRRAYRNRLRAIHGYAPGLKRSALRDARLYNQILSNC